MTGRHVNASRKNSEPSKWQVAADKACCDHIKRYAARIGGGCSEVFEAPSEVPQGSDRGPILSSLFINDLNQLLRLPNSLLYADDTNIFRCVKSPLDYSTLQRHITTFEAWSTENRFPLNVAKYAVLSLSTRRFSSQTLIDYMYMIGNITINRIGKKFFHLLGMNLMFIINKIQNPLNFKSLC